MEIEMLKHENYKDAPAKATDDGPKDMVLATDGKYYPEAYARAHFTPEPDPVRPVRQ